MTSDPHQKRDQADHGQHHSEGDGGVGGDDVEKEVDYGRHGERETQYSSRPFSGRALKDRFRDRG